MNTTEARVKEIFADHKFGAVEIVTKDAPYLRGISNSDVLPTFKLGENMALEVTIYQHEGEKISNRKGFGWVHTNFQCAVAEKQRSKAILEDLEVTKIEGRLDDLRRARKVIEEAGEVMVGQIKRNQKKCMEENQKCDYMKCELHLCCALKTVAEKQQHEPEMIAELQKHKKAAERARKKLCNKHNTKYGCSNPCSKCLDFSKDRTVTKIQGNIFFRNGYGASSLDFVYFAIVKTNSEGVPMLYVRRRPASNDFLGMSARDYQKNYVAKNKHIKNSFCICIYKPPEPQTAERKPDLTGTVQSEVAGSQNLPAVIGQTMPVLAGQ